MPFTECHSSLFVRSYTLTAAGRCEAAATGDAAGVVDMATDT